MPTGPASRGDDGTIERHLQALKRDPELQRLYQLLIDGLPEDLRRPLVLSSVEEMTSREVAEAMGIPEGTVRTRVMRARTELRRRFVTMREGQR